MDYCVVGSRRSAGADVMAGYMQWTVIALFVFLTPAHTFVETPKFSQLRILYPGYPQYGGHYTHEKLQEFVVGPTGSNSSVETFQHSTAAIRLSWTLNRYGGRHAIGRDPVVLSTVGRDSFAGRDGQQYIFRNAAFGPFLAERYGNPLVSWGVARPQSGTASTSVQVGKKDPLTAAFRGRQGIVRVVSYRRQHEDGHVALWDCTRFHESRDWTNETHVIAVEFWESADSYCVAEDPARDKPPPSSPRLEPLAAGRSVQLVPRNSLASTRYLHEQVDDDTSRTLRSGKHHRQRAAAYRDRGGGGGGGGGKIWIQ